PAWGPCLWTIRVSSADLDNSVKHNIATWLDNMKFGLLGKIKAELRSWSSALPRKGLYRRFLLHLPAGATDFTWMLSPLASPVTLAFWSANLSSSARVALSLLSSVYTLSPTTRAYFDPLATHERKQPAGSPSIMWWAPHMASLTFPVKISGLAAEAGSANSAARIMTDREMPILRETNFISELSLGMAGNEVNS